MVASAEVVRLGTPPNPPALLPGDVAPAVTAVWDPLIEHAVFQPLAVLDFLALSGVASNLPTPIGTIGSY